eukprot:CAMPEP_0113668356 /NCGR_PEP_ID=MMETSP0038_2-20120614/3953_1 /TAXON_ID=2898 /ORGANISM="Cryptomonas paramecium" /LENGTH=283 /DNA_ID=CAMNT_0000584087 /DNA_START=26 /DNA_END=873 /DNA_ORIENTATION=- /assembly_acc=CAM_ASM_000170
MGCGAAFGGRGLEDESSHQDLSGIPSVGKGIVKYFDSAGKVAEKVKMGVKARLSLIAPGNHHIDTSDYYTDRPPPDAVRKLAKNHARFLITVYHTATSKNKGVEVEKEDHESLNVLQSLEERSWPMYFMDNIKLRKISDELLALEAGTGDPWKTWLNIGLGTSINSLKLCNQPNILIGGYFILSQMLSYSNCLLRLELSSNGIGPAAARLLALALRANRSLQVLQLNKNMVHDEGATSIADALKLNNALMLLDMRENGIRSGGVCALTDATSRNTTLTKLDLR